MKFSGPNNQVGSIFLEVLVAMLLLAGGMVGGLEMTRTAQIGLDSAKNRVLAATLAQSLLEEKAALSHEQILSGAIAGKEVLGRITREWKISSLPLGLKGVTIRVICRWTDRAGRSKRAVLNLFRPGGRVP